MPIIAHEAALTEDLSEDLRDAWMIECGGRFETYYYGESLTGSKKSAFEGTQARKTYPGQEEIKEIANAKKTAPFIFWNKRNADILAKQFACGPRRLLRGIDVMLHKRLPRTKRAKCTTEINLNQRSRLKKKPGEKQVFLPG